MSGSSSDRKKRLSCHQYGKLREEKEQREQASQRKNLKIDSFFTQTKLTPPGGDNSSTMMYVRSMVSLLSGSCVVLPH